jgi:hypothetical protein
MSSKFSIKAALFAIRCMSLLGCAFREYFNRLIIGMVTRPNCQPESYQSIDDTENDEPQRNGSGVCLSVNIPRGIEGEEQRIEH